ncbi:MAG: hypothetical protein ABH848_04520 [Candidatus Omnitrophota bacterium]
MEDIRPLKDIIEINTGFNIWPVIILFLLIAIAIGIFLYFKNKQNLENLPQVPVRSPEEIAREELATLLREDLPRKRMVKVYYIRLSDIIRKYIEGKLTISTLDRTTWEVYQDIREKGIKLEVSTKIKDFLEECDLVKFAKYNPGEKEISEVYNRAIDIIDITINFDQLSNHESRITNHEI